MYLPKYSSEVHNTNLLLYNAKCIFVATYRKQSFNTELTTYYFLLSGTLFIILLLISMHYEKERLLKFNVLYYKRNIELPNYLFR